MVRQAHHERLKRLASRLEVFDTGMAVADHWPQATKRIVLQVAVSEREVENGSR
jgi:hypothetical protein